MKVIKFKTNKFTRSPFVAEFFFQKVAEMKSSDLMHNCVTRAPNASPFA